MTGGFRRGMLQTVKILSEWTIKSFYLQKYKIWEMISKAIHTCTKKHNQKSFKADKY